MSQYLLNITARSTGNNINALLPSTPVFNAVDSRIVPGFKEENNIPDNAGQTQLVQQSIVPVQPAIKEQVRNREPSYFSKHIKRDEVEEEISPTRDQLIETKNFRIEKPSQITWVEKVAVNSDLNEPAFVNKAVSKIALKKKEAREKKVENTGDELIETGQVGEIAPVKMQKINPPVELITPNQPGQLNRRYVQNTKMKEAAPKLVIGKIIVEILPPKLLAPQKVITRVVQSSSKNSFSKSNKLTRF